ncbi:unnamed protein product [Lupinus luteus]|uniref:Alpha/beta hydrolase fold-3 domain-containing protein n=1 Tax=Lupinus luteus TaxID=3873 RepID=A0AAV1W2M3_LUPLU
MTVNFNLQFQPPPITDTAPLTQPTPKPHLPWKTRLTIAFISALGYACRRSDGTVNRRLFNFFDRKHPPNIKPVDGVYSSDVAVDLTRDLWFRFFVPFSSSVADDAKLPVVVFFHGGGFSFSSPDSVAFDAVCRLFCCSFPAVIVSVNYRLSPEYRYPCQYDDGFDVVKFLDENGAVLPKIADMSKCFLAGDSSGGNLAHHVAVIKIIGLISIQTFFGGEERTESEIRLKHVPLINLEITDWEWKAFLPIGSDRDHEAANVSGPNAIDIESGLSEYHSVYGWIRPVTRLAKKVL